MTDIPDRHSETLTIYRSSAGSGKTYTLTREYIYLALFQGDPRGYRKILAVTFTNKAMKEMKDRIIEKLDMFGRGETDDSMAKELMEKLGWDKDRFRESCAALLSEVLHQYSHFAITTIDAFFQQIVRSFARELHIAGGYRLELEQDLVYRQVIAGLLEEVDTDDHVKLWLEEFSFSKLDDAKGWEVERELLDFLKALDMESFRTLEEEVRLYDRSLYDRLRKYLDKEIQTFENTLKQLAKQAIARVQQCGLTKEDFAYGNAANFIYVISDLEFRHDRKKLPSARFINCVNGTNGWFKKDFKPSEKADSLLASDFPAITVDILDYWNNGIKKYRTCQAISRNIYLFALAVNLLQKLAAYKKDHDILFISDATRLIRELVMNTDAPFIYEKAGSFFDHFLIDEFQDTSRFQWDSFRPLVENSLSQGNANLIVGDVKQSIYRWRGGDLELLQNEVEQEFLHFTPKQLTLDTNYRSRKNVVEFNNAVFTGIHTFLDQTFRAQFPDSSISVGERIQEIFHDVFQNYTGKESIDQGYIEGRFIDKNDFKDSVSPAVVEILEHLQDRNVPLREIAILVRNNKEGKDISEFLMHYTDGDPKYRYDVVSNETLHLSASSAVSCLVSALRYLQDPSDILSKTTLLYFYQLNSGRISQEEAILHTIDSEVKELLDGIHSLKKLPLYSIVEHLIDIFDLSAQRGEFPYLQTFQDQVLAYMKRERGDIQGFVQFWDDKLHKQSIQIADDLDAIRVMTIHKAKGLEFHSVIIPYINWPMSKSGGVNWYSFDEEWLEDNVFLPVNFSKGLTETKFANEFLESAYKNYLDNLNVLYVAFTRAVHDLWFISQKKGDSGSVSQMLENFLLSDSFALPMERSGDTITYGNRNFKYSGKEEAPAGVLDLGAYAFFNWQDKVKLKPVPERYRSEERQISISTGIYVHEILSRVKYLKDVAGVLTEMRFAEGLDEVQYEGLRARLKEAFRIPGVKAWFDESWEVRNEQPIFAHGEEYRPDRVIHRADQTLVIDYKTGKPKNEDRLQMKTYISLVSKLYSGNVEGRILYLENMEIVTIL